MVADNGVVHAVDEVFVPVANRYKNNFLGICIILKLLSRT